MGFGDRASGSTGVDTEAYELKPSAALLARAAAGLARPARARPRVLDVGCSDGQFGALVRAPGPPRRPASTWSSTRASAERLDDVHRGRPQPGPARPTPRQLRRDHRRRHPRARHRPGDAARGPRATHLAPGRRDPGLGAELRPLVPPRPGRPGPLRLRPARPARPRPRAVLHARAASSGWSNACGLRVVERGRVGSPVDVLDRGGETVRVPGRARRRPRPTARPPRVWPTHVRLPVPLPAGDRFEARLAPAATVVASTAEQRRRPSSRRRPRLPPGSCSNFGTDLGRRPSRCGYASNFFEAQARAFLDGHLAVPPGSMGIEGFVIDGTHLHVLRSVPGAAADPGAAGHPRLRRPDDLVSMLLAWVRVRGDDHPAGVAGAPGRARAGPAGHPARGGARRRSSWPASPAAPCSPSTPRCRGSTTRSTCGRPRSSSRRRTGWCGSALEPTGRAVAWLGVVALCARR